MIPADGRPGGSGGGFDCSTATGGESYTPSGTFGGDGDKVAVRAFVPMEGVIGVDGRFTEGIDIPEGDAVATLFEFVVERGVTFDNV